MLTTVLVDDEILTVKSIKKTLEIHEELGVRVLGMFENGKEALQNMKLLQPDFAIVDIRMETISGIELMRHMKEHGISTKVIVLSAYRDFEYAQQALQYGAYAYLTKPVEDEKLFRCIREISRKIEQERAVFTLGKRLTQMGNEQKQNLLRNIAEASFQKEQADALTSVDAMVSMVHTYCETHLGEEIQLQSVADFICMNKNYFCSFFKKNTGQSLGEYLTGLRLSKAKTLLYQTDYKVNIIAEMVGYKNPSHFGRIFKDEVGMTPAEYRLLVRSHTVELGK